MDAKNWIVKNQPKQQAPEPFEKIVDRIISEHPEWTEKTCQNWREEKDWHVGQAKRILLARLCPTDRTWKNVDERELR